MNGLKPETPIDPPTRTVSWSGGTLAYSGDPTADGPVLLCVHGLPGSVRDFRWLEPTLEGETVVRLELPGFGTSTREGYASWTVQQRADAVVAFMDAFDLRDVVLVGHSAGCIISARVARQHPQRVRQCVLIAPPGPTPHYNTTVFRALAVPLTHPVGYAVLRPVFRRLFKLAGFPSGLSETERVYTVADGAAQDFSAYADDLAALQQPALVAWAEDDRRIPAARSREALDAIPNATPLHFDDGGHNIQKTQAVEIGRAMRAHLRA